MSKNLTADIAQRLAEIDTVLTAYRAGWLESDQEHVRELQAERLVLERETGRGLAAAA